MAQVAVQKLNKAEESELKLAIRYFTVVAAISNVHLTTKQIELLAFTAMKGTISSGGARKDFIDHFKSSKNSLENLKHILVKKGFIVKRDNKYQVTPQLAMDFGKNIVLQVNLDLKVVDGQSKDGEDKDN